jgi:hypothetical protein
VARNGLYRAKIEGTENGRVYLVLPFDTEKAWGVKARYHAMKQRPR